MQKNKQINSYKKKLKKKLQQKTKSIRFIYNISMSCLVLSIFSFVSAAQRSCFSSIRRNFIDFYSRRSTASDRSLYVHVHVHVHGKLYHILG